MTTWFSVDVRVYDKRVFDEFWQWMRGQQIGREEPRECGHVAEGAVDLEHVHASKKSVRIFLKLSIWMPASNSW
jgi:hypothetical protein